MTDRCPSCHAAVADSADWCSLCFTRLGAVDEPPAPQPMQPAPSELVLATAGLVEPTASLARAAESSPAAYAVATDPAQTSPADADPADSARGWPCHRCGAVVSLDSDLCPECGAAFLAEDITAIGLQVPGVGDLARAGQSTRLMVGLFAAVVITGGLFLLLFLLGTFL